MRHDSDAAAPASDLDVPLPEAPPANDLPSLLIFTAIFVALTVLVPRLSVAQSAFAVEETTIAEPHAAIRSAGTTCAGVVESYIEPANA